MRWLIDIIDSMAMSLINLQEMVKDREAWSTAVLLCLVAQPCSTLCDPMDFSLPGSSVHGDSLDKNTGVDCHALLQGSSQPRDPTQVSCIADRFFTI